MSFEWDDFEQEDFDTGLVKIIRQLIRVPIEIRWHVKTLLGNGYRHEHKMFSVPRPLITSDKTAHTHFGRLKPMYRLRIYRSGTIIKELKTRKDLLVWRGQMCMAYLLSKGIVGTSSGTWKMVTSENTTMPDMGDDSGDPISNEFAPVITDPVTLTWEFEPTVKPSGGYQLVAWVKMKASAISGHNATLRKIGIIDDVAPPHRSIIAEDSVVPIQILTNDTIEVEYWMPLG